MALAEPRKLAATLGGLGIDAPEAQQDELTESVQDLPGIVVNRVAETGRRSARGDDGGRRRRHPRSLGAVHPGLEDLPGGLLLKHQRHGGDHESPRSQPGCAGDEPDRLGRMACQLTVQKPLGTFSA